MQLIRFEVPTDSYELAIFSDNHRGALAEMTDGLQHALEWTMARKHRYWIHLGDTCEAITTDDRRFQLDTTREGVPLKQMADFVQQVRPFARRGITALEGNHEQKHHRVGSLNTAICQALGLPVGTWSARVQFADKHGGTFKAYFCHGMAGRLVSNAKGWEQQEANIAASLKLKLSKLAGDCSMMVCGHYHRLLVVPPAKRLYLADDGEKLMQRYLTGGTQEEWVEVDRRWYGCSGSFLKSQMLGTTTYAERAGYAPVELGWLVARVEDRQLVGLEARVI